MYKIDDKVEFLRDVAIPNVISGGDTTIFHKGDIAVIEGIDNEKNGDFVMISGLWVSIDDITPVPIGIQYPKGCSVPVVPAREGTPHVKEAIEFVTDSLSHDTKDTNPKDAAATSRLDLSVFPDTALCYGALAMVEGDQKYAAFNYRVAGVQASVYKAAVMRHLMDWYNGEDDDRKTGVPHLASALAGIAVLIDAIECEVLVDDRPPVAPIRDLLTRFEEKVAHLQRIFPSKPRRFTQKDLDE